MTQRLALVLGMIILAVGVLAACGGGQGAGEPGAAVSPMAGGGSPTRGGRAEAGSMLPASPESAPDAAAAVSSETQTSETGTGTVWWPLVVGILVVAMLGVVGVTWQQRAARSTDHR